MGKIKNVEFYVLVARETSPSVKNDQLNWRCNLWALRVHIEHREDPVTKGTGIEADYIPSLWKNKELHSSSLCAVFWNVIFKKVIVILK